MRSALWQKLFLALALLSGLALAGFAAWQQHDFQRGFMGYLDEMMLQRVQPVAPQLASAYAAHGNSWDFLRDDRVAFGELVEAVSPRRRDAPPPPDESGDRPPSRDVGGGGNPERDEAVAWREGSRPPNDAGWPPPGGRGPRRGPPDLMGRLQLVDAAGQPVVGSRRGDSIVARVPVQLDGKTIGELLLSAQPQLQNSADIAFERAHMRNAIVAVLVTLTAALVLAFALARWLLAPVRALTDGTRALAAGDLARRVTVTRRDELGALARDFNHLATTLEQHRNARRQWGADIAHELRTPLAILRGEIQAMQDGIRPLGQNGLASLQAECDRLGSLIEDLYQLALADAGALDYRFETIDATELVLEAVELHRPGLADLGLALDARIARVAPVRADARRLGQLIDNLLVNARRYTDTPGLIRVSLGANAGQLQLIVEDSPPGVPANTLPQLFDRLFRVDASRGRGAGGAGLGLAICRAIVDAHGGSIAAQASPLGGLRVIVNLPLELA